MTAKTRQILAKCCGLLLLLFVANAVFSQCGNISFSSGNFNNWKGEVGCVTNDIAIDMDCNIAVNGIDPNGGTNSFQGQHAIITPTFNGGFDRFIPNLSIQSPLGDGFVARLGDYRATTITENFARGASLEYRYQVTELNALVTLYFAIVLEDPANHDYGERPFFSVDIIDPNGNTVDCIQYIVAAQPGIPGFAKHENYFYRDWTPVGINLTDYLGQSVTLRVVTSDCGQEAHLGYAYLDATCQEPVILSTREVLCKNQTVTLTAPDGMDTYSWRRQEGGAAVISSNPVITVNTPGTYTCEMVPFSTSGIFCPFTLEKVVAAPAGTIDPKIDIDPELICSGDEVIFTNASQLNGTTISEYTWDILGSKIPNQNPIARSVGTVGTHNVTLDMVDQDGCPYKATGQFEVVAPPNPIIDPAGPFCDDEDTFVLTKTPAGGTWSGTGVSASGVFDPKVATANGSPHVVSYSVTDVCTRVATQNIVVHPRKDPTITQVGPFCNDDASVQLQAQDAGGTWSGPGISGNGNFNPATAGAGVHTISYKFITACPSEDEIEIEVIRRKNPAVKDPGSFCVNDAPYQLEPEEPGGRWSGPGVNPTTGVFNPAAAGVGTHSIVHVFDGFCPSERIIRVQVILKADANFSSPTTICENDTAVELVPVSSLGRFNGNGMQGKFFNPTVAGPGTHDIEYLIPGSCGDTVVKQILVHPYFNPTISPVPTQCSDGDAINLQAVDDGGTWSGNGITNSTLGVFDPDVAGAGSHIIRYSFGGACPDFDEIEIDVLQRRNANFTIPDFICFEDDSIVLSGVEMGGVWSGNGVADAVFYPENAGIGTHTITYDIAGVCGDMQQRDIEVVHQPDAKILGPATACVLEDPVRMDVVEFGGEWSGTGVNASGFFDPQVAGLGNHVITYSFPGRCGVSDQITIKVTDKLDATIDAIPFQCEDFDAQILTAGDVGGIWSGTGITDANTGLFDPDVANIGDNLITYTIGGLCGDTASVTIRVEPRADARILHNQFQYCFEAENDTLSANGGGQWSGNGINNQGVFLANSLAPGSYDITYIVPTACPDTDRVQIRVLEPIILTNYTVSNPLCYQDCNGGIVMQMAGGTGSAFRYVLDSTQTSFNGRFNSLCEGSYKIQVNDGLGCLYDTSFVLTQPDSLYALFTPEDEKCFKANGGATVDQIFGGTAPFTVSWSDGKTGLSNFTFSEGQYQFTVSDSNNCNYSSFFDVGFVEGPQIYTHQDSVSCFGFTDGAIFIDSIVGGKAPFDITWYDNSKNDTLANVPVGRYHVEVIDDEACISRDTIDVLGPSLVEIDAPTDSTFCDGAGIEFIPNAFGGNGNPYQFHFVEIANNVDRLYSDSSWVVRYFASDKNGCVSDTNIFEFIELPPLEISIEKDTIVCPNSTVFFATQVSGGLSNQYQYLWNDSATGATRNIQFDNSGEATFRVVTLTDGCSTPASDSVFIAFHPPSIAGFDINPNPAQGCEPLVFSLRDTSINSEIQEFYINGNLVSDTTFKLNAGDYDVQQIVISNKGCRDTLLKPSLVNVYPIPKFELYVNPAAPTEVDNYFQFYALSSEVLSNFSWEINFANGDSLLHSNSAIPEYFGQLDPGFYDVSLIASTIFGCINDATRNFKVVPETRIFVPNAFSPNGNGINEAFRLDGVNLDREDLNLKIFNRWGELVYETSDPLHQPWTGVYQESGKLVQPGVYVWVIVVSDPIEIKKELRGTVTVLR